MVKSKKGWEWALLNRIARVSKRRGFFRRQDGSVSVEFVVWMPVFVVLLGFIADASNIYLIQASMWDTAMDCARRMSVGEYTTVSAAQTNCKKELLYAYKPYTLTPTFGANSGVDDTVEIKLSIAEASIFGVLPVFGGFGGSNVDVTATMKAEQ